MTRASQSVFGFFILLALGSVGVAARHTAATHQSAPPSKVVPSQVTFNRDVAPIVFRNCAQCHHPGEVGPFPLLSYADVKSHGRQIAFVTSKRIMPPWLPEPGELKFADELRLSDAEIATIQAWVDQGEIEGNPADHPPPPVFTAGCSWANPT